jgi:3-oxoacyl-[acyl-carrier-protein] synthase III
MTLGPTTARNDRRRPGPGHSTHAVFGDGSAALVIRTFSGDIVITKR